MSIDSLAKALPKELKIGPFPFQIKFEDGWIKLNDGKKWGLCDHATHVITISDPAVFPSETMLVSVALHEVLHAVWSSQALGNKVKEEDAIASLEIGLVSLFKDNPKFLDWIKKGLK